MAPRNLHVVHFLIRQNLAGNQVGFLLYLHEHWSDAGDAPYLALPAKKTVTDPLAEFIQGTPLDVYIDAIARDDWKLPSDAYDVDQEIEAVKCTMPSPTRKDEHNRPLVTDYTIYPIDLWVAPEQREPLGKQL